MNYDHIIKPEEKLNDKRFHLSCGFYDTTSFLFEKSGLSVTVHCKGNFTFRNSDGETMNTIMAKPMTDGRECYMDIMITVTDDKIIFRLPDYSWTDNYPHCDGESDRWDAEIIGINDEIIYTIPE